MTAQKNASNAISKCLNYGFWIELKNANGKNLGYLKHVYLKLYLEN